MIRYMTGAVVGGALILVATPNPPKKEECTAYTVAPSPVEELHVLPPPAPVCPEPEKAVCPEPPACPEPEEKVCPKEKVKEHTVYVPRHHVYRHYYRHRRRHR